MFVCFLFPNHHGELVSSTSFESNSIKRPLVCQKEAKISTHRLETFISLQCLECCPSKTTTMQEQATFSMCKETSNQALMEECSCHCKYIFCHRKVAATANVFSAIAKLLPLQMYFLPSQTSCHCKCIFCHRKVAATANKFSATSKLLPLQMYFLPSQTSC